MFNFKNKRKKEKQENADEKNEIDFIIALYLNQRFVYDILAIKNDGFTEFYDVRDQKNNNNSIDNTATAKLGTNNEFSLITAGMEDTFNTKVGEEKNNEKNYKKTHTPTSLFMQAYNYLKQNNIIKSINMFSDIDNISSGDFIEIKSVIELTTIVDFFEDISKTFEIIDAFNSFATTESNTKRSNSEFQILKRKIDDLIKILVSEKDIIKYAICKIEDKPLVLKLNTDYFINSDCSEIKNGEFRIIGKVLEVVPEDKDVLLNRENALSFFDPSILDPIKNAFEGVANVNFTKFEYKISGKTCVIMPIAIGI